MGSASRLTFSLPFGQSSRESDKGAQADEQSDADEDDGLESAGCNDHEIHLPIQCSGSLRPHDAREP